MHLQGVLQKTRPMTSMTGNQDFGRLANHFMTFSFAITAEFSTSQLTSSNFLARRAAMPLNLWTFQYDTCVE
jgi:hypothetical protein